MQILQIASTSLYQGIASIYQTDGLALLVPTLLSVAFYQSSVTLGMNLDVDQVFNVGPMCLTMDTGPQMPDALNTISVSIPNSIS